MTDHAPGERAADPAAGSAAAAPPSDPGVPAQPGPGGYRPEPEVPRGPGVVPPFPAPPTEGRSARLWLGLGVGALVAALCCGGGLAAGTGLVVSSAAAFDERIQASVGGYFDAVSDERFAEAYRLLCDDAQDAETPAEFASRVGAEKPIRSYDVGTLNLASSELVVPVQVVYDDGTRGALEVHLAQDESTGDFEVCGVER